VLIEEITQAWNMHARPDYKDSLPLVGKLKRDEQGRWSEAEAEAKATGRLDDRRGFHHVLIMEDIAAGAEQGFLLLPAGQVGAWVQSNMGIIEGRARAGDKSMQALVQEVRNGLGNGTVQREDEPGESNEG
jgi:hypothetical protein